MRYSQGRTFSLALHEDAEDDLDEIYSEDEDAGADIEVFLEEAKNNQDTLYRIVYAFHPREYRYYILAILKREFDYDLKHPRTKKILAAYDALDIPRY